MPSRPLSRNVAIDSAKGRFRSYTETSSITPPDGGVQTADRTPRLAASWMPSSDVLLDELLSYCRATVQPLRVTCFICGCQAVGNGNESKNEQYRYRLAEVESHKIRGLMPQITASRHNAPFQI